jgi:CBS-domain-containing membrane protein
MTPADYRIESASGITGPLLPVSGSSAYLVHDSAMAVVMAAKSVTIPAGQEIRVVHVPTGEVIFRKSAAPAPSPGDDW